jgi:hypothetical protein
VARAQQLLACTLPLLVALAPLVARADGPAPPPPPPPPAQLKAQADALMDAAKFADAYALYVQAYSADPDPALLYDEGRALEGMGDYPAALEKLDRFAHVAPPDKLALVPGLGDLIADVRAHISTLVVHTNVPQARVLLRERMLGVVQGARSFPVRAGGAELDVLADGYEPFKKEVDLPAGGTLDVVATLVAKADLAQLAIRTTPAGSLVLVDRVPLGPTPVDARLAPGTHDLELRHEGYLDERVPLTVGRGERRAIDVALREPPPFWQKWWFWTTVGVAVVAGVAVGVAVTSERGAGNGSFSPGQVRAPLTIGF